MKRIVLNVPDMACGHCVAAITGVLESFGGCDVAADLEGGKVSFAVDGEARMEEICSALEEEGFPATMD
jgi:copper chaperone CopZ